MKSDLGEPTPTWAELSGSSRWTTPGALDLSEPAGDPGVYVVKAPRPIVRARGEDKDGVLLIGEATNLARRIRQLSKAMGSRTQDGDAPHRPGLEYSAGWGYDFNRKFKRGSLTVEYWFTAREDHELLEAALLERYRWTFLDRPPLNSSIGKWRAPSRKDGWILVPPRLFRR
jgi:hypothetical protein